MGEKPGLSGAAFFDLYTDPREESGKMLPTFPAKGMLSGRFADALRQRQIARRTQGEQLAAREWPVLALHSRPLGGEPHPRWSVETAACQASTIGQLTTACATWFRDANEDDISNVGCWHFSEAAALTRDVRCWGKIGSRFSGQ